METIANFSLLLFDKRFRLNYHSELFIKISILTNNKLRYTHVLLMRMAKVAEKLSVSCKRKHEETEP